MQVTVVEARAVRVLDLDRAELGLDVLRKDVATLAGAVCKVESAAGVERSR
jgi:hypothetical protein